jgi:hypothetical protein
VDPDLCLVSFRRGFCKRRWPRFVAARRRSKMCSDFGSLCYCTNGQASAMRRRQRSLGYRLGKCSAGGGAGKLAISRLRIAQDAAESRLFPPLNRALVRAMACEAVAETQLPISRQSVADLTSRARQALAKAISSSTVWRMLHEDAIKPWQFEH